MKDLYCPYCQEKLDENKQCPNCLKKFEQKEINEEDSPKELLVE